MLEFYRFSGWWLIGINVIFVLAIVLHAVCLSGLWFRLSRRSTSLMEAWLEGMMLLWMLCLTAKLSAVQYHSMAGFITPIGYNILHSAIFLISFIPVITVSLKIRRPFPASALLIQLPSLPIFEHIAGGAYPYLVFISVLLAILRSIHIVILRKREFKTTPSMLSAKEAIDSLDAGIMFCEPDGAILLQNRRMQKLMVALSDKLYLNGRTFYYDVTDGNVSYDCHRCDIKGSAAYELPNGRVWMFSCTKLKIRRHSYFLFYASDQTERWHATSSLKGQYELLNERNRELHAMTANIRDICKTEELLRAKRRVHNTLGQRISLLIRVLRDGSGSDEEILSAFTEGLPDDLKNASSVTPQSVVSTLIETFRSLGVNVTVEGELPTEPHIATAFSDILTEAVTNAVHHGYATMVNAVILQTDKSYTLTITDNGTAELSDNIMEGGGISGMRHRARHLGGELTVKMERPWTIIATVPKGASNDTDTYC